ncbi:uncharacterized protein LOC110091887 [Dendrobium catenatum]|uniref:uncharacterized protein LOC110091887 n=1 Tax=Dendrobium catenatum TaxID=906689 RepID=UPI0009F3C3EC|nr:uncharacterized protein LOC110091887 [Dendrobium catenatum]XP_020671832.1 uncharacterized protein LOC110091887 [Dendrobium catenatum]
MSSYNKQIVNTMEGRSPDRASAGSGPKRSSISSGGRHHGSSSTYRKDFLRKFVDSESLTVSLDDWFSGIREESNFRKPAFDVPFELTELQSFDYALEGVPFQQLIRMPNALQASTSDAVEATAHLAIEDFLHAGLKGLWETFWDQDLPLPFSVACIHSTGSKFYPAEKAIASGKLDGLCAAAILLKNDGNSNGRWDQIVELALLRPDIGTLSIHADQDQPHSVLGEALFFAIRVLVSRSLSKSSAALRNSNCVFVLLVDSQYAGVVKLQGDINRLDFHAYNVYECSAEWIRKHAKISVSTIDRVWNKLGNANWGDVGTLQVLLATFHSMILFCGVPKYSPEQLATEHSSRLQTRRTERHLVNTQVNGNGMFRFQQRSTSPEIVEVQEDSIKTVPEETLNLEKGSVIYLEDSNWQKAFQINGRLSDTEVSIYGATLMDEQSKVLILYVGSSPTHMDLNLWYQVQRQTKILSLMKQRGLSNKHVPQAVASGRIVHPGQCNRPSTGENCSHPWCGTPMLATSPYGETVSYMVRNGLFGPDEALRCCHDCLSAIAAASSVGIRHGDICPESIIYVISNVKRPFFVLIGWGHAVLEEKDRPSMNLYFSSTYALQEGKLCAASDAESLIYLLYFSCGGVFPNLDSVEGALEWREMSWSRRVIQQKLGEISAVLKAFADYVDSLCGTPYHMDYDIWLRRLRRAINEEDHGKDIDSSN